ncbi:unnamed protein product [Porites lobata]|uniref:EGF-like domain-containing protein n=1 Tax=Porites lobata TaxID=104759 RepID=A0ABN8PQP4_9CNID|nr:unnamed protein product [Porites lobata]
MLCQCFAEEILVSYIDLLVTNKSRLFAHPSNDIDECRSFHGCQEKCINTVGDYHCTCSKGYRLEENNKTCTDIDECATENLTGTNDTVKLAHCQQLCTNIPGSYLCSCRDGFYLSYDKKHCTVLQLLEEDDVSGTLSKFL